MTTTTGKFSIASIKFGNLLLAITIATLGFVAFCIYYYFSTYFSNDYTVIREFMLFKENIMQLVPFFLALIIFFLALWVYSIYVDFNNLFEFFDRSPTNAMFNVIIPVINLYGIGMSFTRLVNFLDADPVSEEYEKNSFGLKIGLVLLYSGIVGTLGALYLGSTFSDTIEQFQKRGMLIFSGITFLMIILTAAGLITMVNYTNKIIRYRAATVSNL